MKYLEYVNSLMKDKLKSKSDIVVFGQNVSAGSCIGGLSRGIKLEGKRSRIINTPNSENTSVGVGFGLMLNGVSSVFYMKQLDFLLLGIDQIVNTFNYIRTIKNPTAAFSIVPAIVDSGFEGLQSSLNTVSDFSSIAMINAYTINNKHDADFIINNIFMKPGFRIIGVSQRLGRQELISIPNGDVVNDELGSWFKYSQGTDVTLVSFNFAFTQTYDLSLFLKEKGVNSTLYSVNCVPEMDWSEIIKNIKLTKKLVLVDDSKSHNSYAHQLLAKVATMEEKISIKLLKREHGDVWYRPNSDEFGLNKEEIFEWYKS